MRKIIIFSLLLVLGICLLLFTNQQAKAYDITLEESTMQCQCSCTCQPYQNFISPEQSDGSTEADLSEEAQDEPSDVVEEIEETQTTGDENLSEEYQYLPSDVLISEFVADPITGEKEWVELYNATNYTVDLTDWILQEGSGQKTILSGFIEPNDYLVIEKSSLNNSGDLISLKDPLSQVIDQVAYGNWDDGDLSDNSLAAEDPYSIIRKDVSLDTDIDVADFVITTAVTKGQANVYLPVIDEFGDETADDTQSTDASNADDTESAPSVPTDEPASENEPDQPVVYSSEIRVNEFLPNPSGSDTGQEWIELYNFSSADINLKNWILDDTEGGSLPFKIPTDLIIPADDYLVFNNEETNLVLNNTSDEVRLINPNNEVVSLIEYSQVKEEWSYAYFESGWQWTKMPTAGSINVFEDDQDLAANTDSTNGLIKAALAATGKSDILDEYFSTTIEQVRELELGTKVKLSGIVSVQAGAFSQTQIYLQDKRGIQIYCSKKQWPNLKIGDEITILAKLSESNGENRLLISSQEDIQIISNNNQLNVVNLTSEDIGEDYEGSLIEIEGELVQKKSSQLIVADEFGEFIVYLKQNTGLSSKIFNEGERLKITGIVSQYKDEYRILPRAIDDIENLTLLTQPVFGNVVDSNQVDLVAATQEPKKNWLKILAIVSGILLFVISLVLYYFREKIIAKWMKFKISRQQPKMVNLRFDKQ